MSGNPVDHGSVPGKSGRNQPEMEAHVSRRLTLIAPRLQPTRRTSR